MKKIISFVIVFLLVLAVIGYAFYEQMERKYQTGADTKRIYDIHKLAVLIDSYKEKTGYYPLSKFSLNKIGTIANGRRIVVIISPYSLEKIHRRPA